MLERWPSGRRRTIGNRVYVNRVSRVRIPLSPPHPALLRALGGRPSRLQIYRAAIYSTQTSETTQQAVHKTAEKIRALLQFSIKLHERGWGRSRVRDYYDIWRIVTDFQKVLDWSNIPNLIQNKCIHKHVVYNGIDDIFQEKLMINVDNEWEKWLSAVVNDLPQKKEVIDALKQFFKKDLMWL